MATKKNISQLITLSPPVGLGGEKLWLCPSLSKNGDTGQGFDLSGNVNNGYWSNGLTLSSTMGLAADKEAYGSRAYDFDGFDEWMRLPTDIVPYDGPLTASIWLKLEDSSHFFWACGQFWIGGNEQSWGLYISGGSLRGAISTDGTSSTRTTISGGTLDTNWNHLCMTHDPSSGFLEIFLNGISVNSSASAGERFNSPYNYSLAAHSEPVVGNYDFRPGRIDDARFFNRVLTLGEIKHLSKGRGIQGNGKTRLKARYNEPAGVLLPLPPTIAWYRKSWAISKPNYKTGYARNRQESAHPNLWGGLEVALCPSLGITGNELHHIGKLYGDGKADLTDTNWVAGNKGIALDFNGSSSTGQGPIDDLTVSAVSIWFKPTQTIDKNAAYGSLIDLRGNSAAPTAELSTISLGSATADLTDEYITVLQRDLPASGLRTGVADGGSLTAGVWHHLVCTCEPSGTFQIYLNGVEKSVVTSGGGCTPLTADVGTYRIGTIEDDTSLRRFFDGEIGTTLVYSRSLSPSEIKQLHIDPLAPFRIKTQVQAASAPAAFEAGTPKTRTLLGVGL